MGEFPRIKRLPPYVFNIVNDLKAQARRRGEDVIDFGMGNPERPPAKHIVDKLCEVAQRPETFDVELDSEKHAIVTIGSKEGLAHLALATVEPGDAVLVPNPAYPIHQWAIVIAGADIRHVPLVPGGDFFAELEEAIRNSWPTPKMLVLNFPANPTAQCVDLAFFQQVVDVAREHGIWIVHDLAYADIVFDGYAAPSILQVPGAMEVAVEFFSLSKSYNMPGWRVGFMCGNERLVQALARLKSYLDYGIFTPIQVAGILALEGPQEIVEDIRATYEKRRDTLCDGLVSAGWVVNKPKATMFVWARIPELYRSMGSLKFSKKLLAEAKVAVSPGIGFGEYGDEYVRFSLIENEHRTRQAIRCIRDMLKRDNAGTLAKGKRPA
jgi:alanine-synthesizing transaminase